MITSIALTNFKKHLNTEITLKNLVTLIHGPNSSGKTSILEAISLFTTGKGIFNLTNEHLISKGKNFFQAELNNNISKFTIKFQKKKEIYINQDTATSSQLAEHFTILGITPYASLAFWQEQQIRRKIINRIILQYNPTYGLTYKQYHKAITQRNALIKNDTFNKKWANILDPIIQQNGLKINQMRKKHIAEIIDNIPQTILKFLNNNIKITTSPTYEEQEKILSNPLSINFEGPHITKFHLTNNNNLSPSTGEQKKMLLALILSSFNLNNEKENLLLLDDILSNLDNHTTLQLINILNEQKIQTIITDIHKIEHPSIHTIQF